MRGLTSPQDDAREAQSQALPLRPSDTSSEDEIPDASHARAANPQAKPVAAKREPRLRRTARRKRRKLDEATHEEGQAQALPLRPSDESLKDEIPAASQERAADPQAERIVEQSEPNPKLHQWTHEEVQSLFRTKHHHRLDKLRLYAEERKLTGDDVPQCPF